MKNPDFRYILSFIAQKNRFVHYQEILDILIISTGKTRGVLRIYLLSTLKRLVKRRQLISYKEHASAYTIWGLPGWLDFEGKPLSSHLADQPSTMDLIKPFAIISAQRNPD